jgi:hypothetical protein
MPPERRQPSVDGEEHEVVGSIEWRPRHHHATATIPLIVVMMDNLAIDHHTVPP